MIYCPGCEAVEIAGAAKCGWRPVQEFSEGRKEVMTPVGSKYQVIRLTAVCDNCGCTVIIEQSAVLNVDGSWTITKVAQ